MLSKTCAVYVQPFRRQPDCLELRVAAVQMVGSETWNSFAASSSSLWNEKDRAEDGQLLHFQSLRRSHACSGDHAVWQSSPWRA